jgi:uncharacterized membrane protein|tara:strand:+ start:620 stop:1342 length:723 start_codon:yes stop_codon:yes gene_type:complete
MKNIQKRFWEVDFLRGIAILMMIAFHIAFDLRTFAGFGISLYHGIWNYLAHSSAFIFVLLVGVSLTLSFSRTEQKAKYLKYFKRGVKIFSWGLLITLMTWIFFRRGFVVFGVLHLIGVSIILAYPFLKLRDENLWIGVAVIGVGILLKKFRFGFSWLVWLGFMPIKFDSVDYFSILPWFGVVLVGIAFGNLLYSGYKRQFSLPDLSKNPIVKVFSFLGRHSLLIYLLHQPILIGIIYLLA